MATTAQHAAGIRCPHCGERDVATAQRLWVARGIVLRFRYGSHVVVGCRRCVRRSALLSALVNLLAGWWCFPWGALTPVFVLQNVVLAFLPGRGVLDTILVTAAQQSSPSSPPPHRSSAHQQPSAPSDGGQRAAGIGVHEAMLRAFYVYAARLARCGPAGPIADAAVALIVRVASDDVTEVKARAAIAGASGNAWGSELPREARRLLAELVAGVSVIAEHPSATLTAEVFCIGRELGFTEADMREILDELDDRLADGSVDEAVADAYRALGLEPTATPAEVKERYRELLLRYHPDHAAANGLDLETATTLTQRLTAAHDVVLQHQAAVSDVA